jgi:dephospho-CoA kinase
MLLIGLTGSIGMGKSTIAKRFAEQGVPVIDADQVVHDLYEGEAVAPIEAAFPGTTAEGLVDRAKLSQQLMDDPSGFKRLEAIVHPLVRQAERRALHDHAAAGAELAVLEVPLLFETGGDARVDVTVVVSAPEDVQRERVLAREGMTAEKFDAIRSRQLPEVEKRRRADFIVETHLTIPESYAQVDLITDALRVRRGTAFQRLWQ